MTVLKSVLSPVLSNVLSSVLGDSAITRFFTNLVRAGSMYYTIPTITLSGDFDVFIKMQNNGAANFEVLLGAAGDDLLAKMTNNSITLFLNNSSIVTIPIGESTDGELHIIRVVRIGTAVEIFLDGVSKDTGTSSDPWTITEIGRVPTGSFYNGILADVDLNAQRFYALGENFALTSTAADSIGGQDGTAANVSSSELFTEEAGGLIGSDNIVTNGTFDTDTAWTKIGGASIAGGVGIVDGTISNALLFQSFLVEGNTYRAKLLADVSVGDANNTIINNANTVLFSIVGSGNKEFEFTQAISNGNFIFRANGGSYTVDDVELHRFLKVAA